MNTQARQDEEKKAQAWAESNKTYYVDTRLINDITAISGISSNSDIATFHIIPLAIAPGRIDFGYTDKTDRSRLALFTQKFPGKTCNFYVITESGFDELFSKIDVSSLEMATGNGYKAFADRLLTAHKDDAFRLISQLAYQLDASDIHIEPKAKEARIRFRIDGTLHPIANLANEKYQLILSGLQNMAGMKWGSDMPQGGRISIELVATDRKKTNINMRLETIPTMHGEELIVRLLSMDITYLNLDNMQLTSPQRVAIDDIIARPHGMVLAVGPTGSGKTSMLYSMINKANSPEIKIVTLEDPVEYDLPDTSQIPVRSDKNELFAEKLRAVVRQDPNIVMIGEIRDVDTAKTALQAALTGHLVLSTFHASSAVAAIARLMDMIGQNPIMASAVRLIQAQRLVRKICEDCKESYEPTIDEAKEIKAELKNLPAELYKPTEKITLYRGKGCESCNGYGYKGRVAIVEQLPMTPAMESLISGGIAMSTSHAVQELAEKEGMISLLQGGLVKALAGITTTIEVYRVVEGK